MPRLITSLGPKSRMVELFWGVSTMKSLITCKDLLRIVNSDSRISSGREIHRRHALSMQAMSSLMVFLGNKIQKYPSSPTRINDVSI